MRKTTLFLCLILGVIGNIQAKKKQQSDREYWAEIAYKISAPVLENMSKGELQKTCR